MFKVSMGYIAFTAIVVLILASIVSFAGGRSALAFGGLLFSACILVWHIAQLNRRMRFDKTHMTSLFENATEGIILTNKSGEMVLVNPAAEMMFNYNSLELIGRKIEILIPEKYRKSHIHLRQGFHNKPENRVMGHGRDLYGIKKNGEEFSVEVSLSYYKQ